MKLVSAKLGPGHVHTIVEMKNAEVVSILKAAITDTFGAEIPATGYVLAQYTDEFGRQIGITIRQE